MANRLTKAWRRLIAATVPAANPKAIVGASGTDAATPGLFQFGESNLVDPPQRGTGAQPVPPPPGTIVKAQVAERWMNQVTRGLTPEAVDDYLTTAISGDTLNQFALFEEMEEKWPEIRLALYKHKLKAARRNPRIVPPDHPQNPALAKEKADFANYVFAAMRNWHRTAFNLLDAVGKGVSAARRSIGKSVMW